MLKNNVNLEIDYKKTGLLIFGVIILFFSAYMLGLMTTSEEYGILSLAVVLGISGAFLILTRPTIGLALLFFFVPISPVIRIMQGDRAITLALGALLVGIFASKILLLHEKVKLDRVSQLAGAFLGWSVVTSLWAYSPETSLGSVLRLGQMLAIYVVVLNCCRSQRHLHIITLSFAIGATIGAAVSIFKGVTSHNRLVLGEGINPNLFSAMLSTGFILIFYHLRNTRRKLPRVLFVLSILLIGFAIVLAQSRGVWIGIVGSLLVCLMLTTKNKKLVRNVIMSVILVIGLLVSGYYTGIIKQDIIDRFDTLLSGNERVATAGRNQIWKVGFEIVKDTFPLGVGVSNFPIAYKTYVRNVDFGRDAHNTFLGVLAETGLVGFALFGAIFVYLFKETWRIKEPTTRFIQTWLLSSVVVINLSATYLFIPWFWFVLLMVALNAKLANQTSYKGSSA